MGNTTYIPLPEGATQHGNPNLICLSPRWYDFVVFLLSNYVAHAATLHSLPGQRWRTTVVRAVNDPLLPITGIDVGIELLHKTYDAMSRAPLRLAAVSGALCTVRRKNGKRPRPPPPQAGKELEQSEKYQPWIEHVDPIPLEDRRVQGVCELPEDFELVTVRSTTLLRLLTDHAGSTGFTSPHETATKISPRPNLPSTYNLPKAFVSLAQAIWAASTLYRARADQIDRYGYAAFGLTVAPYAVMSSINLLGNLFVPEYPCVFLVSSPDMQEASQRGSTFHPVFAEIDADAAGCVRLAETTEGATFKHASRMLWMILVLVLGIGAFLSPLIIVGALSHFQVNGSTVGSADGR